MKQPSGEANISDMLFQKLQENLKFGVFKELPENAGWEWSPGLYKIIGIRKTVKPKLESLLAYVVQEEAEEIKYSFIEKLGARNNFSLQFTIIDSAGTRKRLQVEVFFEPAGDKKATIAMGIIKDITENYEYKQALEEKVYLLDKSNRNLQEFVYVASHDLQEPVRKISTFAERLGMRFGGQIGEEGNLYLSRMMNSVKNMETLLEDLLTFSRLSVTTLSPERVSLNECLHSAINDLEIKIEETGAVLETDDLPLVEGYFTQLKQLFFNLIGNALKFHKSGIAPHVSIKASRINPYSYPQYPLLRNTHYTQIEIKDNGIGFEAEYAEKIFLMFQRLHSKAEYSGSGVGLAICKKIAENHHGVIFAQGLPGSGSIFTVLLPNVIS